jgi:acylphosphatase
MARERRHVYYSGWVQGVGFRFTARHLARGFDVAGFVRNLPDGRVELVAEGDSSEVNALLAAIRRELGDKIRDAEETAEIAEEPPATGFEIRY